MVPVCSLQAVPPLVLSWMGIVPMQSLQQEQAKL